MSQVTGIGAAAPRSCRSRPVGHSGFGSGHRQARIAGRPCLGEVLRVNWGPAPHQTRCLRRRSAAQIAWRLVLLGLVRADSEAIHAKLSAWLEVSVVREFRGKLLGRLLCLEQSSFLGLPRGDLAFRIQVEIHWLRTLPLGSQPGHSSHTDGYCSGHCWAEGGYYASQPGGPAAAPGGRRPRVCPPSGQDFLRQADPVLELPDGTVIEWERQTTDARSH